MRTILAATGALLLPVAFAAPASAASTDAQVAVFHGVPGLTVDVYVDGDLLLEDFEPGTVTDPVPLPAGDYDLAVYPADADPGSSEPAISADGVAVPAGADITVAAHLAEDGTPVLTPFVNDVSSVDAGQARITVRHTAAAPAVDVRAGGEVLVPGLTNPDEAVAAVPAGTVSADVVLAGTDTVAIGPADLDLAEGANTIVYAWGSAEDDTLALAVQTISGLHSSPAGVPSGDAGLVSDTLPWQLALVGLAGAGVLVVLGGRAARSRSDR